ncbi:MAG: NAD(+) synthase [Oscillospiraceae bacterium]|nr:NAD(+) synthase [Oscillospiraceae bacterium]
MRDGFVKVAAASPVIRVADCDYNAERVIETIRKADALGVKVLVFPELTLTGVSCYDLIAHRVLLEGAKRALGRVVKATKDTDVLAFVGLPWADGPSVSSAAAAVYSGELLEVLSADDDAEDGPELFRHQALSDLAVAVEIGAEKDRCGAATENLADAGAALICQMASFPATTSSTQEAELNARYESKKLKAGLILAAPGCGESTTDNVFTGLCLIAENGKILAQDERADALAVSEIDVQYLTNLRRASCRFAPTFETAGIPFGADLADTPVTRRYPKHPHLPEDPAQLPAYCERMLEIQVAGLVKRMEFARLDHCVVGISGGVDSTLAVMVSAMAVKKMGLPSTNVIACTMPCFGTSSRTKSNAIVVAEQWGCEVRVIDIGKSVYQHFDDIGHAHDDYSVAFENAQARERTQVLMDIANKVNGLDVGTEDLSEYIDGWCTYNGDHTSMYDVNLGLTKTQVRAAVAHIAEKTDDRVLKAALYDVLDCPVTPELLPIHDDMIEQKSEDAVGSYSLQDFFTWQMLVCGFGPRKTFRLAKLAYGDEFTDEELIRWLRSWCKRLFTQQFKRSCLMDGPAVMDFSISPRTGFLMPSDGESALFRRELDELEAERNG